MGLKIETWNIAYRKKTKNTFRDTNAPFEVIPNGHKGWYADPFLFDYKGETYLFAEYFSYKLGRGVISVSKYNPEILGFFQLLSSLGTNLGLSTINPRDVTLSV